MSSKKPGGGCAFEAQLTADIFTLTLGVKTFYSEPRRISFLARETNVANERFQILSI